MVRSTATPTRSRSPRKGAFDNTGLIPVLARAVREVETSASRGPVSPSGRTKFQVIALLVREERARAKTDPELGEEARAETLKRLDGVLHGVRLFRGGCHGMKIGRRGRVGTPAQVQEGIARIVGQGLGQIAKHRPALE